MARGESYEEFVKKHNPGLTTDDCYTPPEIYDVVKNWALKRFNVEGAEVIRPFYPGGDYEAEDYEGKLVLDNPPFSILSKVLHFYDERGVTFFLFSPALTSSRIAGKFRHILVNSNIRFQNGATIRISFLTNLAPPALEFAGDLDLELQLKQGGVKPKRRDVSHHYSPFEFAPSHLLKFVRLGENFSIPFEKYAGKTATGYAGFGGVYTLSEESVAKLRGDG